MNNINFAILFLMLVKNIGFAAPLDFRGLYLHGVELEYGNGDEIHLTFEAPCGGAFYGVVAQEIEVQGKKFLEIGVAFRQRSLMCSGGAEPRSLTLNIFAKSFYEEIRSMDITGSQPLSLARTYDSSAIDGSVYAVAENRCGSFMGALIKVQDHIQIPQILEVGVVHRTGKAKRAARECNPTPQLRKLFQSNKALNVQIRPAVERGPSLEQVFKLQINKVEAVAVNHVIFRKACNEVPIGIVESMDHQKYVGILVGKYLNIPCLDEEDKKGRYRYSVPMFPRERTMSWNLNPSINHQTWEFKVLGKQRGNHEKSSIFEYLGVCADPWAKHPTSLWTVWSLDHKGRIALGVLVPQSSEVSRRCKMVSRNLGALIGKKTQSSLNSLRFRSL